ncbi:MAG: glycosyltransferase family 4 protein [Nanoarchaeota archaeon]|nr:glycosyltransferase family 4 protein [Nanoarchaeota archaeon]
MKKIAIFHPQLNNFGGGETVALIVASILSKQNMVEIFTSYAVDKKNLETFFDLNLERINIVTVGKVIIKLPILNSAKPSMILRSVYKKLEKYDLVIDTGTNGWFDKKLKTKSICYVHYPFFYRKKEGIKSIINPLMIQKENAFRYDKIFCNSNFTKNATRQLTNKEMRVLYPPVKVKKIKQRKKLNRIVTIGRFSYDKKHEVMIDAFKELYKEVKDCPLYLIGSFQESSKLYKKEYLKMLMDRAEGYPIKFHINMPHHEVLEFLEESKIYWHARGYGETDLNEYENFGITTVEAMAAGCVPIAINLGAQPEIVDHEKNGFCWNEPKELVAYTEKLIKDPKLLAKLSKEARKKALRYDIDIFRKKILTSVKKLLKN